MDLPYMDIEAVDGWFPWGEKKLFKNLPNDLFITRIAHNPEEAYSFIEVGFEYVSGAFNDGGQIFRKRK